MESIHLPRPRGVSQASDIATPASDMEPITNPGHQLPSSAHAWWTVALLTGLYALSLMDRSIISLVVNDIRRDLGISDFAVGMLNGLAFALFYVSFGLFFGWASDRYSRRGLIAGGLAIWSLATAACGLARTVPQLVIARFVVGAGEGALNPSAYSLIADCFPRERLSTATSVFGAGSHLGASMSLLAGGLVLSVLPETGVEVPWIGILEPWRAVFLLLGVPGMLVVLLVRTLADPGRRRGALAAKPSFQQTLATMKEKPRFYLGHNLGFALMMSTTYGYAAWSPTYLIRVLDVPVATIGIVISIIAVGIGMTAAVAAGYLVDRLYVRGIKDAPLRLFVILAWIQLIGLVGVAASPNLTSFIIASAIFIGSSSYPGVAAAALQITAPPTARGQISAVYMAVTGLLGAGIGPVLVGFFTTFVFSDDGMVGWSIAATGVVLLPIASLLLYIAMKPMQEHLDREDITA